MSVNSSLLSKIFAKNTFNQFIIQGNTSLLQAAAKEYFPKEVFNYYYEIIEKLYKLLQTTYRNEYYYKNTMVNKLLIGRHSVNTTTALSEVPVNQSIADFILINGKATVYEIKTELDNFDRLPHQINDYYKAFTNVCVITSENQYHKVVDLVPRTVGVSVLTRRGHISTRREPITYFDNISHEHLFNLLRKEEYQSIIYKHFNEYPDVAPVFFFRECFRWFKEIDIELALNDVTSQLKERRVREKEEFKKVPYELKGLAYFANYNKKEYEQFFNFMHKKEVY